MAVVMRIQQLLCRVLCITVLWGPVAGWQWLGSDSQHKGQLSEALAAGAEAPNLNAHPKK
eukprot:1142572-Amphidinium_carterae.1